MTVALVRGRAWRVKSTPRQAEDPLTRRMWRWLVAVVDRKRGALVFVGKFIVAMAALWLVAMSGPYAWVRSELTRANAEICGWLLGATGLELEVRDGTILSPTFALTVIPGCSGLEIWVFLVAAILAFPSSLREKLLGVGGSLVAILALNIVRITSLFLVGQYRPQYFDTAHLGLWPAALNVSALLILGGWLAWTGALGRRLS